RVFFSPDPNADPAAELAEARQSFFTPVRHCDPFGQCTSVEFEHWLLPCRTRDALKNTVQAENDFRVLQPWRMTDPNGNRTEVLFDGLGLVAGTAVMGKVDEELGDSSDDFITNLTQEEIDAFFADPHGQAGKLLGNASTRIIYDVSRFHLLGEKEKPIFAATIARETHVSDLPDRQGQKTKLQISFSFSDGFGREIQKKIQAEPEKINGIAGPPRWVASGWTIFNNKGKPVKQYEPFFDDSHDFKFGKEEGVSPILFYDPLGRVIATLHPNHSYEKVVFDPWQQVTYDVNDTVTFDPEEDADVGGFLSRLPDDEYLPSWHQLRTEPAYAAEFAEQYPDDGVRTNEINAANKAAAHVDTPTTAHLDSLGRPFLTIAHNRVVCPNHALNGTEDFPETRVELDIEGNQRAVRDAKGRIVMRYEYDMLGTVIQQASMEAGERWLLNDITGNPIRTWDSRGFSHQMGYDALRRPVAHYLVKGDDKRLVEKTIYGDTPYDETSDTLEQPELTNHRGQAYKIFDNAGVVTSEAYDFKGNLISSSRQLRENYTDTADWQQPDLEEEIFRSRSWYDALNRPVQLIAPHSNQGNEITFDIIRPGYNEANLLERVDVWPQQEGEEPDGLLDPSTAGLHAVTNIDYDAKGQRERIEYGNGAITRYQYDEETYRLIQLLTTRPAGG
ncbi:MAG: toxin, partial [Candidatus Electrothrix sp. ATG1]|nr:toxin [Candidatus Electrothrix sp. ATG1]